MQLLSGQKTGTAEDSANYLFGVQLGQVAQNHGEGLRVVLVDPKVNRFQAAHVEKKLGLLQSHGAARRNNYVSSSLALKLILFRTLRQTTSVTFKN